MHSAYGQHARHGREIFRYLMMRQIELFVLSGPGPACTGTRVNVRGDELYRSPAPEF